MLNNISPSLFEDIQTPSYFYDIELLAKTLETVKAQALKHSYTVHYAMKANANERILRKISSVGLGSDCVSGNEIKKSIECGFNPSQIVFAGVGKTDREINYALNNNIFCFHCESFQELEVINQLAGEHNKVANVALRINPNVYANTNSQITTGTWENKFGMIPYDAYNAYVSSKKMHNVEIIGLHFHIGSQIADINVYETLAHRINEIQNKLFKKVSFKYLNVGGGLGIDYENPKNNYMPDFYNYFETFAKTLQLKENQKVHFELGRSIVGQCGLLITRVLYVKHNQNHKFVVVDAGMNDLIRPALYGAKHYIENISSHEKTETYNVVGPVCETSDSFGKDIQLSKTKRGDILAVYSAGAYGEVMGSEYNLRDKTGVVFTDSKPLFQNPMCSASVIDVRV